MAGLTDTQAEHHLAAVDWQVMAKASARDARALVAFKAGHVDTPEGRIYLTDREVAELARRRQADAADRYRFARQDYRAGR
jgi:hypothetical protein